MAFPSQRAEVLVWSAVGRKEWTNVLNYEITGTFSGSFDIQAAAVSVDTHFKTVWLAMMGIDLQWLGVDIRVYNAGVTADASVFSNTSGSGAANALPNEVAAIVRLQSSHPGKTGRGRTFLSGVDMGFIQDGFLLPSGVTALQAIANLIKATISIQGQSWVPNIKSKHDTTFYAIQSAVAEVNVGTQRRRRPRR